MSSAPIRVLSLGAGVQSSALLLMSIRGVLPRLDCAVFADTQYEPRAVYAHLEWLKGEADAAGVPLHTVTAGNIREDVLEFRHLRRSGPEGDRRKASIPLHVKNPDGTKGQIRRQCTPEYKIEPVENFVRRQLLGLEKGQRAPKAVAVEQWMGITADESRRATHPGRFVNVKRKVKTLFGDGLASVRRWSGQPWKTHHFPFLNLTLTADRKSRQARCFPADMTRQHVIDWLASEFPGRKFPRSACVCCPYRSDVEWRAMRDESPEDFADACDFDDEARVRDELGLRDKAKKTGLRLEVGAPFVHSSLIPLRMVNLDESVAGRGDGLFCGQPTSECEGMCGV